MPAPSTGAQKRQVLGRSHLLDKGHAIPVRRAVPQYVTLKNRTREVEIGAFLSEEERVEFHQELRNAIAHFRS